MKITPEIKTCSLCFSKENNFVSWKSGLKFNTSPEAININKSFLIDKIIFGFYTKGRNVCVADGALGIVLFVFNKEKLEDTIRIKTKNKITKDSCYFDKKLNRLFVAVDNKIIKFSIVKDNNKAKIVIIKKLKTTLKKDEFINYLVKEDHGEFKGFWAKTNKNGLYFIEVKDVVGLSQKSKLWRITTYTKRTNFEIPKTEVCFDIKTKNGFLYVITNEALYKYCIISTKLTLVSFINFSVPIDTGKIFFTKNHIIITGNNKFGAMIVSFSLHDFTENSTSWCFAREETLRIKDAAIFDDCFFAIPSNTTGLVEKSKIVFDKKLNPYFVTDYDVSNKVLNKYESIVSNFAEDTQHLLFLTNDQGQFALKAIHKETFDIVLLINLDIDLTGEPEIYFDGTCLYLITDKGMTIIHGKRT